MLRRDRGGVKIREAEPGDVRLDIVDIDEISLFFISACLSLGIVLSDVLAGCDADPLPVTSM